MEVRSIDQHTGNANKVQEKLSSPDPFEAVCSKHGKLCMIKTGISDGPSQGKTYLICSHSTPCSYKVRIKQNPRICSKHSSTVELAYPFIKDGEKRLYIRCVEGKKSGKWCAHTVVQRLDDQTSCKPDGSVAQASLLSKEPLKVVNSIPKKLSDMSARPKPLIPEKKYQSKESLLSGTKDNVVVSNGDKKAVAFGDVLKTARNPAAAKEYILSEIRKKKGLLQMAARLPDKGEKIKQQLHDLQNVLKECEISGEEDSSTTATPSVTHPAAPQNHTANGNKVLMTEPQRLPPHVIREMYASSRSSEALYGGRMTQKRLDVVTTITTEAIENLHKQLESCPDPQEEAENPKNLTVNLMTHQRQALLWLAWREKQNPPGGILADDMGLGKTLTMISLVMKDKQQRKSETVFQPQWLNKSESVLLSDATLIVCPASLIHQWAREIEARCKSRSLSVVMYHGPNREQSVIKLAGADVVLTTYNLIQREVKLSENLKLDKSEQDKAITKDEVVDGDGILARIAWRRVILDEAHNIKNARSTTALSVCRLRANHRWALTGTPIQNDLMDFYSLLKFLRCAPFDELKVWKRWVDNKLSSGDKRLSALIRSLLLRRTKEDKLSSGASLVPLPEKQEIVHEVELGHTERKVYDYLFGKCREILVKYLANHEDNSMAKTFNQTSPSTDKVKGGTVLLMLLRLRQSCSHPVLTKKALVDEELKGEGVELDLVSAMKELDIGDKPKQDADLPPLVSLDSESCKIAALLARIKKVKERSSKPVKFVIVSQWTSMLELVGKVLTSSGLKYYTIKGDVTPKRRSEMVESFNSKSSSPSVMLVSLRAGGVGLNLIGASHLFIMDLHWNPALEQQACDRIYRVGQRNNVTIHKFICKNTIEEQIRILQRKKLDLASVALTGSKSSSQNKLSLEDLKMLFGLAPSSGFTCSH